MKSTPPQGADSPGDPAEADLALAPTTAVDVDPQAQQKIVAAQASGNGRWYAAIAVLVVLTEQTALGFQLIAPALTDLAVKYETTQIIWAITIFTLVGGVVTPLIGKLGDRYGKRRVLLYAAGISIIGAAISALASNFEVFLVGRALTGVSAAFLPVTYALMRDVFPERLRNLGISIATNGVGVVTIAGPFIAGFLIDNVSTESVFWFIAALSVVGSLGTIAFVPESPIRLAGKLDLPGAIGLGLGFMLLLLGVAQLQDWGKTDPRTLACLIGGVLVLGAWWWWEHRAADPFIDPRVLKARATATVVASYAFASGAIVVIASNLPTFLQTSREQAVSYGFGLSATGVAVYLFVPGITTVAGGLVVGFTARRYGFRVFLIVGAALIALGSLGLSAFIPQHWGPIVMYGIVGLGAMVYAAGPGMLMLVAPPDQRGVAAGMLGSSTSILGSLFAQIAGLVLASSVVSASGGAPIYTIDAVRVVFYIAAGMGIVGVVLALAIPKARLGERQGDPASAAGR